VVEIQSLGSKTPLFFVHGVGGGMFWVTQIYRGTWGLNSGFMRSNHGRWMAMDEFGEIEEMAAKYVADLRAGST